MGQGILVKIKFNIIASLYDYNPNLAAFMKVRVNVFFNAKCRGFDLGTLKIHDPVNIYSIEIHFSLM